MKYLIIFALLFLSFNLTAQKAVQVEDLVPTLDSLQQLYVRDNIEGCIKLYARYGTRDQVSCPVYLDEQGWYFYIYISPERNAYFITLNKEDNE